MYWRFDAYKFSLQQLPPLLRGRVMSSLLKALTAAAEVVYDLFVAHRARVMRKLDYNGFTISLERFLNELFDEDSIYITEFKSENVYLHYDYENLPNVYLGYQEEGDTISLSSTSPQDISGGFVVMIPSYLATDDNIALIRKWVDYYRMAGTIYRIESYE